MKTEHLQHLTDHQLDQLMDIWLTGNLAAHTFVQGSYWHAQAPMVRAALQSAEIIVAMSDSNDQILGFIGLQRDYIAGIFVRETSQHQGIGTALLTVAKNDHQHLQLNVYVANHHAIAFYHALGFQVAEQNIDSATGQSEYRLYWHR